MGRDLPLSDEKPRPYKPGQSVGCVMANPSGGGRRSRTRGCAAKPSQGNMFATYTLNALVTKSYLVESRINDPLLKRETRVCGRHLVRTATAPYFTPQKEHR